MVALALVGCAASSPAAVETSEASDPVWLLTRDLAGINVFPDALLEARVQVDKETGCVVASGERDDVDRITGVIFPKGTHVSEDGKFLVLLDGSELHFGEVVGLAGGQSDVSDRVLGDLEKCAFESYFSVNPPEG